MQQAKFTTRFFAAWFFTNFTWLKTCNEYITRLSGKAYV
ncbi:hypothetical protein BSIN_4958 [Burkholderia singularis]|uniref:Uncharacterized protein n=1 Tax=Burkholderia singularis TaxID=1503053 RepID=A0A238HCX4_9BURK|nr:hypothetical protein BSIN_4958 [Burkholderia singularis]